MNTVNIIAYKCLGRVLTIRKKNKATYFFQEKKSFHEQMFQKMNKSTPSFPFLFRVDVIRQTRCYANFFMFVSGEYRQ